MGFPFEIARLPEIAPLMGAFSVSPTKSPRVSASAETCRDQSWFRRLPCSQASELPLDVLSRTSRSLLRTSLSLSRPPMRPPYTLILILVALGVRASGGPAPGQTHSEWLQDLIRRKNTCPDIEALEVPEEVSNLVRHGSLVDLSDGADCLIK